MANASLKALAGLVFLAGCGTPAQFHGNQTTRLAELPAPENISITTLERTDAMSVHLVQVRDAEGLHVHARHDLTVFIQQGHGLMRLGDREFPVRAGDVLAIPRGVPHAFINRSGSPALAVAVFSPPFDGVDTVPVGAP